MDETPSIIRARSLADAIAHLSAGGARLAAGGTDLAGSLRIDGPRTSKIVDIREIDELRGIDPLPDGGLRIGSLTTLADVAADRSVRDGYQALGLAALAAGRPDLRARATIGGDLCQRPRCWYLRAGIGCVRRGGDLCLAVDGDNRYHGLFGSAGCHMVHPSEVAPALVSLGARARIVGADGMRVVAFDEFFVLPGVDAGRENVLGPADVLTDVLLPPSPAGWASAYRRVADPGSDDTLASVAVTVLTLEGRIVEVAVVLGAAAPVPWRSREAEALLIDRVPTRLGVEEAADAAMADAVPLADNRYKVGVLRSLLIETLEEVSGLRPRA